MNDAKEGYDKSGGRSPSELRASRGGFCWRQAGRVRQDVQFQRRANVNGKIFAMQAKGKLVVKLPRQRVDELVVSGKGKYFDPGHGKLMKEWAAIDSPEAEWVALAKEAHNFVKSRKS
jgi:hypothetical protein